MTRSRPLALRTRASIPVQALLLAGAFALFSAPAAAQAPLERQSDGAVKALFAQVDDARDKFEGNLDGSFKGSMIRSATTEVSVQKFLQDLQDNSKKLKDRFTDDYAAGPEVETLLKQGNIIDSYMQRTPGLTKGRSEWDHLAATFKTLAGVYGTTFPLPDGAVVRRMNDRETADAANSLANAADQYKNQVNQDKTLAKADKESGKKMADALKKSAQTLKSRVADGKPATAELKSAMAATSQLETFTTAHPVPLAASSWADIKAARLKIEQSFGLAAAR